MLKQVQILQCFFVHTFHKLLRTLEPSTGEPAGLKNFGLEDNPLQTMANEKSSFPRVPYVQVLPEGLKDQTLITIHGEPKPNAEQFTINICRSDDVAFHIKPRFNEDGKQVIVRNTRIDEVWGPQERELPFFPFTPGRPFVIEILCTSSGYRVEVDKTLVLNFQHRIKELDQLTHFYIHQDVVLKHVNIGEISLKDPYVQNLPEGVKDQMLITVHGAPKEDVERFEINICRGTDVAFHFNPRFNEDGKQVIMRTSRMDEVWGHEEREIPFFPFSPGKPFVIKILCTASGYRVETDSNLVLHYAHRIKELKEMTHIFIKGVALKNVHVEGYLLKVPYVQALPEGLKDQSLITIYGAPREDVQRFDINICSGEDVAFHFNPRFNENGKQVIVMAALIYSRWGSIVTEDSFFPFRPGKPFEIRILCTSSGYRVEVDRIHVLNYEHRIKELDQITHIHIHKGVVLKHVQIDR
ncbi:hypothetical protein MHYP_G00264180 [Metynnis hypsauchen]